MSALNVNVKPQLQQMFSTIMVFSCRNGSRQRMRQLISPNPLYFSTLVTTICTPLSGGDAAEALAISSSAVKAHRDGSIAKTWAPNLLTAMSKLYLHDVISLDDLTVDRRTDIIATFVSSV